MMPVARPASRSRRGQGRSTATNSLIPLVAPPCAAAFARALSCTWGLVDELENERQEALHLDGDSGAVRVDAVSLGIIRMPDKTLQEKRVVEDTGPFPPRR